MPVLLCCRDSYPAVCNCGSTAAAADAAAALGAAELGSSGYQPSMSAWVQQLHAQVRGSHTAVLGGNKLAMHQRLIYLRCSA